MKTIYLCGPMSNIANLNRDEFALTAEKFRAEGFNVIVPYELTEHLDLDPKRDYDKLMDIDIAEMILKADVVVTLMGWETSNGANEEIQHARLRKIPIVHIAKCINPEGKFDPAAVNNAITTKEIAN